MWVDSKSAFHTRTHTLSHHLALSPAPSSSPGPPVVRAVWLTSNVDGWDKSVVGGSAYGQPPFVDCGQRHSGGQSSPHFHFMRLVPVVCTSYYSVRAYNLYWRSGTSSSERTSWSPGARHGNPRSSSPATRPTWRRRGAARAVVVVVYCCWDPLRVMHGRREERVMYLPAVGCM